MIISNMPAPGEDTIILMCGPPVMCKKHLFPLLTSMGYKEELIFEF
jgi:NAD(P)H-flavin reductase